MFFSTAYTFVVPFALPGMPKHLTRRAVLYGSCDIFIYHSLHDYEDLFTTPYMIMNINVLMYFNYFLRYVLCVSYLQLPYRNRIPLEWCLLWKVRHVFFLVWFVVLFMFFFPCVRFLKRKSFIWMLFCPLPR